MAAPTRGPSRARLKSLGEAFERASHNVQFQLIDPRLTPDLAKRLEIERQFHARVEYGDFREVTSDISEQGLINTLLRLSQPEKRWLACLTGHGERDLLGSRNHDLGLFGAELAKRGLYPRPVNLSEIFDIPDNATALVIAAPSHPLLESERQALQRYLAQGGNLLWLLEPRHKEQKLLLSSLGITTTGGMVTTPQGEIFGGLEPTITLVSRYVAHPITEGFRSITLFPTATGIATLKPRKGWRTTTLLATSNQSWVEIGGTSETPIYDAGVDRAGPIVMGVALEKNTNDSSALPAQRIAVFTDTDFLSNRYLINQGNLSLGLRIVNWISPRVDTLALPKVTPPDATLTLHGRALQALAFFAFIGFPATLLATAFFIWRWRQRL